MVETLAINIRTGRRFLRRSDAKYDLARRLGRASRRQDVELLAFGFLDHQIRLVIDGDARGVANVLRGVKVGTNAAVGAAGGAVTWGDTHRDVAEDLARAVAWAHTCPGLGPLASPWTSHRDLMGFRRADFYDATVLDGRVDPREVHALAGGRPLPPPPTIAPPATLAQLLRVAGAVTGVLPSNRRCFRVFTHAARRCGFPAHAIARALVLTARRIRQLSVGDEPLVRPALTSIVDPRLAIVP